MKLRVWIAIVGVVGLLLGACGRQSTGVAVSTPPLDVRTEIKIVTATPEEPQGTFYFLAANNSDPFYVPGVAGLKDAAAAVGGKAEFVGPMDLSIAAQVKTFEELIANPDTAGIMLYAIDHNALDPMVIEARAKGIPVVIGAADAPVKHRNAFVGYDNAVLGVQAAEWAAKLIGGKGKVGMMGVITGANVTERMTAFGEYLTANYPDIEVVEAGQHDGSAEGEVKALDSYLVAHPDLTLIWWADGAAGQMAQPIKERQAAGLTTLFLATDMPDSTLQAVKDGVFVGSVGQDTYTEAYWCVTLLDALRKGQRVPDSLYLSAILVDKANVEQFLGK